LKFDRFMIEHGYSRCHYDHCVYFKKLENGIFIILLLYVDDMLVVGTNMQDINVLKKKLVNSFAMKDLGAAKKILGMRINRCPSSKARKIINYHQSTMALIRCRKRLVLWHTNWSYLHLHEYTQFSMFHT
jgi:hypothetical protein